MSALHTTSPVVSQWRSACAMAMAEADGATAERLLDEELDAARGIGVPSAEARVLRISGTVRRGDAGIARLRESLDILRGADAPLETGRTLVALGGAVRRTGKRAAAQALLREGLDVAARCGAERLARQADAELRSLGLRPRRRALFGIDALTPSEARVAREAASGLTNRELAQSMFVTTKTIETQLGSVYQKLGIRGRDELASVLQEHGQSS